MRAGMVEFSNIAGGYAFVAINGPELLNAVAPHIENSSTEGCSEPLVERSAVIVTVQVRKSIMKVAEGVGGLDHPRFAALLSHNRNGAPWQDVPGDVHHVGYHQQSRLSRQRVGVYPHDLIVRLRVHRDINESIQQPLASRLQFEHVNHRAIILVGEDRFVPWFPVESADHCVKGFGRVTSNDQLLRRASRKRSKLSSDTELVIDLPRAHVM